MKLSVVELRDRVQVQGGDFGKRLSATDGFDLTVEQPGFVRVVKGGRATLIPLSNVLFFWPVADAKAETKK